MKKSMGPERVREPILATPEQQRAPKRRKASPGRSGHVHGTAGLVSSRTTSTPVMTIETLTPGFPVGRLFHAVQLDRHAVESDATEPNSAGCFGDRRSSAVAVLASECVQKEGE